MAILVVTIACTVSLWIVIIPSFVMSIYAAANINSVQNHTLEQSLLSSDQGPFLSAPPSPDCFELGYKCDASSHILCCSSLVCNTSDWRCEISPPAPPPLPPASPPPSPPPGTPPFLPQSYAADAYFWDGHQAKDAIATMVTGTFQIPGHYPFADDVPYFCVWNGLEGTNESLMQPVITFGGPAGIANIWRANIWFLPPPTNRSGVTITNSIDLFTDEKVTLGVYYSGKDDSGNYMFTQWWSLTNYSKPQKNLTNANLTNASLQVWYAPSLQIKGSASQSGCDPYGIEHDTTCSNCDMTIIDRHRSNATVKSTLHNKTQEECSKECCELHACRAVQIEGETCSLLAEHDDSMLASDENAQVLVIGQRLLNKFENCNQSLHDCTLPANWYSFGQVVEIFRVRNASYLPRKLQFKDVALEAAVVTRLADWTFDILPALNKSVNISQTDEGSTITFENSAGW